jgi:hypothetical protein
MSEASCRTCGAELQYEACYLCLGAGGWHDCGEDTCCCLDGEAITDWCKVCGGAGDYLVCSALTHRPPVDAGEGEA